MSKQIISTNKISKSYKIVKNTEISTGNIQQGNVDNQGLCTCGKWKKDTHSTYNGTIKTNLKSDEYCTCDEGRDTSLCNCYKRNTNATANKTISTNSQNIYIQDNNDYCTCDEKQIFSMTSEKDKNILTEEENIANNTNINTTSNININTNISQQKVCTCGKHNLEINMTTSNNELPIQTTDYDEKSKKEKKVDINKVSKIKQTRSEIREEVHNEVEERQEEISWSGDVFIQVIERLQYLAAEPPEISVQFLNDLMINRTIDNKPIKVLIPIPDNFIQKQCDLKVLSTEKQESKEEKGENICPENVELLNISHAYSIPVPSFNNLEIEKAEMFISSKPKSILLKEQYSLYCRGEKKDNLKIENYDAWEISASERMWSGPIQPVRTNKLGIEGPDGWDNLIQKETAENMEFEKTIIQKEKTFKIINIGDNEFITLKAEKRLLKPYEQSQESKLTVGGPGFKFRVWTPEPFHAQEITIEKTKMISKLKIVSDNMTMPPARKRRQDWNLINKASSETNVNILVKEKILMEQKVRPITVLAEDTGKNKWNEMVRKQKGIKLVFESCKTKKWDLSICKEINLFFEKEADEEVIINDDYNDIKGPQMRPIIVTVLKVNEDEETSSVTSYDVFQNLIVKKSNVDIQLGSESKLATGVNALKNRIEFSQKKRINNAFIENKINKISGTFGNGEFNTFGKKDAFIRLRVAENEQKNQYDKTVKNLVFQTKNLIFGKKENN